MSGLEWLAVPAILEPTVKTIFKAYMLNKAALETFEDVTKAMSDLELCHLRLVCWLIASGMVSTPTNNNQSSPRGHEKHMHKIYALVLAEIQTSFSGLQEIFALYKIPVSFPDGSVGSTEAGQHLPSSGWTIASVKALQARVVLKLKEDMSYRRKLKFQTQDKKKIEELLSRLRQHLDVLHSILPAVARLRCDVENDTFIFDKIAQKSLADLFSLEQEAAGQGDSLRANGYMTAATFKQAKEEYSHHLDAQDGLLPTRPYSTMLNNATLHFVESATTRQSARQVGTLIIPGQDPRPVLVELKRKRDRNGILQIQKAEVNLLCALLSCKSSDINPDLRVLQCLGHLDHPTEANCFALVFALPPDADFAMPMTMHDLLSVRRSTPENLPTLECRRGLAVRLAKAVWRLHQYGWFHKGLSSFNILFFPSRSAKPDLRVDFFIAGFDNMRLQTSLNLTNTDSAADKNNSVNLYRHPAFAGGVTDIAVEDGYAPAFDLWSLGIILCEISMWAPVGSGKFVRGKENTFTPAYLAQVLMSQEGDENYKHSPVSELAHRMETPYWSAVVNCLNAGNNAHDTRWIAEKIIRPLIEASHEQPAW